MPVDRPLVSVLMGVYYQQRDLWMLQRSVESILNQNYTNFELLICDDGSVPEALLCLEKYAKADGRIHLIRGIKETTLPAKLNACLSKAEGEYIARMDDDDFSFAERFEKQITFLISHPHISFVGCNVNIVCSGSQKQYIKCFPCYPSVQDFYMTQPYIHPTLVFRREVILSVGGYSEDKSCDHCEDYDLLLRLYAKGYCGANIQQVLFDYTVKDVKGNRTMKHRWNECVVRYRRFQELGVLRNAFPYVIKPVIVGLIPRYVLKKIKRM